MSDIDSRMWRNVLLAGARGLEYTFRAIAMALSGEQPVEVSGFNAEPSQSGVKKRGKKEKREKRPPSAYNLFVSEQMKLRKAQHPEISHVEHFKAATQDWKTSSKNKKNAPGASEAPAMTEDLHLEDFEDEEEEEATSKGGNDEASAEVMGRLELLAREAEERERAEKEEKEKDRKDKKKRKKERQGDAQENGGTGHHRDEEGTADKRSSKKGKR